MIPYKFNSLGYNKIIYPENASVFRINGNSLTDMRIRVERGGMGGSKECLIDFGDGQTKKYSSSPSMTQDQIVSHTYDISGEYIIQIIGDCTYFQAPRETIEAIHCSNTITSCHTMFSNYYLDENKSTNISIVRSTFKIPFGVTSCANMFMGSLIKTIENGFTIPNSVTDCSWMFYDAPRSTSNIRLYLPKSFKMPSDLQNASSMFASARFALDTDISNIWPDSWNYTGTINLSSMFASCKNLRGVVPADKLWNSGKTFNSSGCFYGCTSLDNYDEIPAGWK